MSKVFIISLATGWGSHFIIFGLLILGFVAAIQGIKRGDNRAYIGLSINILALIIEIIIITTEIATK